MSFLEDCEERPQIIQFVKLRKSEHKLRQLNTGYI